MLLPLCAIDLYMSMPLLYNAGCVTLGVHCVLLILLFLISIDVGEWPLFTVLTTLQRACMNSNVPRYGKSLVDSLTISIQETEIDV